MSVVVSEAGKSGSTFSIISFASSQRQQSFLVRISICILILRGLFEYTQCVLKCVRKPLIFGKMAKDILSTEISTSDAHFLWLLVGFLFGFFTGIVLAVLAFSIVPVIPVIVAFFAGQWLNYTFGIK